MKFKIPILIILFIILSSCSQRNDVEFINEPEGELSNKSEYEMEIQEPYEADINKPNKIMFVNAPDGLRVRDSPSLYGNIIGFLSDLLEILVVREDYNRFNINGIEGKWTFIRQMTFKAGFLAVF